MPKEIRIGINLDDINFAARLNVAQQAVDLFTSQLTGAISDFNAFENSAKQSGQTLEEFTGLSSDAVRAFQDVNSAWEETVKTFQRTRIEFFAPAVKELNEIVRRVENLRAEDDLPRGTNAEIAAADADAQQRALTGRGQDLTTKLFGTFITGLAARLGRSTADPAFRRVSGADAAARGRASEGRAIVAEAEVFDQFRERRGEVLGELSQALTSRRALLQQARQPRVDRAQERQAVAAEKALAKTDQQIALQQQLLDAISTWRVDAQESVNLGAPIPEAP